MEYGSLKEVLSDYGQHVTPMQLYSDMFRIGEGYIQRSGDSRDFKANPLGYYRNVDDEKGHYRVFTEDNFESVLEEMQGADFSILNGITYFGRRNVQEHASKMFALIFDLDGVTPFSLYSFLDRAKRRVSDFYPYPNYVALSGHGVHLYYLFEEPLSLFPNIKTQLKELKYALIERIWNGDTSTEKKKQFQGINQGFRVIGGKTKEGAAIDTVEAFKINPIKFTLDELCKFVPPEHRVEQQKLWKESKLSLEDAKKKYPEWYEKVIVNDDTTRNYWDIAGKVHGNDPYALYHWWIRQVKEGVEFRHRYFCIMCLAIYAAKNDVSYEQLRADAYELLDYIRIAVKAPEEFTEKDVESALECYDKRYCTFPLDDIIKISGIYVPKNRRNGRPRDKHLKIARFTQSLLYEDRDYDWRGTGRPAGVSEKRDIIEAWQAEHPDAKPKECMEATGISRRTVYRYWKKKEDNTEESE